MSAHGGSGYGWVSLTTDYGLTDGFVAACHGAIARLAPDVRVIDITHLIAPGDIKRGAAVLAQTVVHLPPAVHVAVVDPGVGTGRRGVAVQTAHGVVVGPDNGLLPDAIEFLGGARSAVELTNPAWMASTVSPTFHGRDIFAPVAARLALGSPIAQAGGPIDPMTLVRLAPRHCRLDADLIEAEVVLIDRFGNIQLAAPGPALAGLGERLMVEADDQAAVPAVRAATFADAVAGQLIAYVDSANMVSLAVNAANAAEVLGVGPGDVLRLMATDGRRSA